MMEKGACVACRFLLLLEKVPVKNVTKSCNNDKKNVIYYIVCYTVLLTT
uniref:Uncharacterized protein n=1 Tax=Anguilla anguilla TaxID=7936 RepID=A0A0E9VU00_ANGAN